MKQQLMDSQKKIAELQDRVKQQETEIRFLKHNRSPIDDLPIECVQHIISFCSIIDVYKGCMVQNKKWFEASNNDLKTRRSLMITSEERDRSRDMDCISFGKVNRFKRMVKSLLRMTTVTHLTLDRVDDYEGLHRLWQQWSPVLVHLELCRSEVPEKLGLSFPRLTSLICPHLPLDHYGKCHLPLQQIQRLDVSLFLGLGGTDHALVWSMKSLTHLTVEVSSIVGTCTTAFVTRLFTSFHRLIRLEVNYESGDTSVDATTADSAVASLVRMNPQLEEVVLRHLPVTDASLVSLARLTHLKRLEISCKKLTFTGRAIDDLLRAGSRHALQRLKLEGLPKRDVPPPAMIDYLKASTGIQCIMNPASNRNHF